MGKPIQLDPKRKGLIIGIMFLVVGWLAAATFIVPALYLIPSAYLESTLVDVFAFSQGADLYNFIIGIHIVATIVWLLLSIRIVKRNRSDAHELFWVMSFILSLIIHPLGFYIYWKLWLNFSGDGQLVMGAAAPFWYTSLLFPIYGFFLDKMNGAAN
jgi:hypothetical protein